MKKLSLTAWIFIGMGAGIAIGLFWPNTGRHLEIFANIFLRLIKSIIAPLLFGTLVSAMAGTAKGVGRLAITTILYFQVVTTAALLFGFATAAVLQPGRGVQNISVDKTSTGPQTPAVPTVTSIIEQAFPSSIVDAMARGGELEIVIFSLIFGAACAAAGARGRPMSEFAEALSQVMFRYTHYVMHFAPVGVAASMAATISRHGPRVLFSLGKFVIAGCAAEFLFVALILLPIARMSRVPVGRFWAATRNPTMVAFSTASSDAALPLALENMELFGVPRHVVAFVLPAGCSFNLAGTTLFLALASMFMVQACGLHLSSRELLLMAVILMLTTKGLAAVPRASYIILTGVISVVGIPAEAAGILLGVDALLDMVRTAVNLLGNCLATVIIARCCGSSNQD
jgi:Na+/H+-dicarboxylate symporter